ncbi:hypothetical protein [Nitrososphaera sp.]|uniref:hypothetical protein n=1 Tax=Nitrososphaera sp. TaxID=1971748 RepID=UPI0031739249
MSRASGLKMSDGKFVMIAIAGIIAAFAILLVVVSGGGVRHVQIFLPEKTENTLAFREVDGKTALVGIKGIAQVNPTMIMRTGDYALELTVINEDDRPHMLYIDGVGVSTKVLRPGETDVISFQSPGEAVYNYYDYMDDSREPLGQIRAVKVTAFD